MSREDKLIREMDRIAVAAMRKRKQYITQEIPRCHLIKSIPASTVHPKPATSATSDPIINADSLPKSFPESAVIIVR